MSTETIDEYLNKLNEIPRKQISAFVEFMKKECPEVKTKITYAMPMWLLGVKMRDGYVGISPAKEHFSIHLHDENTLEQIKKALPKCKFGKRCINIVYGDSEAVDVVEEILRGMLRN